MTRLSNIIFYALNPLLMPLLTMFLLFQLDSGVFQTVHPELKIFIYILVGLLCVAFPLASLIGLKMTRAIPSIKIEERQYRTVPYIMTLIYYAITYYVLRFKIGLVIPYVVFSSFMGCIVSVALVAVINVKFKISAHCVGISGVLGALIAAGERYFILNTSELNNIIIGLFLLTGIVAASRLWLKAHSQAQIYGGLILGFSVVYSFVSFNWFI